MNNWISVNEKLPTMYQDVLCYTQDEKMCVARLHDYLGEPSFYWCWVKLRSVTHWMPLPDSPYAEAAPCDACLLEDMP